MEELKAYICKDGKDCLIMAIAGAAFGIVSVVLLVRDRGVILPVIFFLFCAVLLFEALTSKNREGRKLKALQESGELEEVISDFALAESYSGDSLRLGRKFVFRKKYIEWISYEEIAAAEYYDRLSIDEQSSERGIRIKLKDETYQTLCPLNVKNSVTEAQRIFDALRVHVPGIEIR